ncbi:MAG: chromate efflux transporter [Actinomycetota bacterium]|nr:chromate efflux transporter [Actinomycetota bacterium]
MAEPSEQAPDPADGDDVGAPAEPYGRLFLRFLRFGFLAWGGPVAQIGMIREELVQRERWISPERFNKVLGVYQVLPGPEATELCVYFGHLSRGRTGGFLAGLGFMLPGFFLMLALSWAYVRFGISALAPAGLFSGFQAAVVALIARAIQRIGQHALIDPWLWAIAVATLGADLLGVHFAVSLVTAGLAYAFLRRRLFVPAALVAAVAMSLAVVLEAAGSRELSTVVRAGATNEPTALELLGAGLLTGLLTFGGAYTSIPFLRRAAVVSGGWLTDARFVDGLALAGVLPAPLIIFGTFVGYVGAGFPGAVAMTAGIFLPAFSFTLIGHRAIERVVQAPALHSFLEGVTAGVVGLITATGFRLLPTAVPDIPAAVIAIVSFTILLLWRSKMAIAAAVLGGGALGMLADRLI